MGDAADDYHDACERYESMRQVMLAAGCSICKHPAVDEDGVCTQCDGTGWLDSDGNPVET